MSLFSIGGYPSANGEMIIPWPHEPMAQELDDLSPGQPITPAHLPQECAEAGDDQAVCANAPAFQVGTITYRFVLD